MGLSPVLIFCWAFGDAFKTAFAVARGVPVQFVLCGVFQLAMDAVLLWQIYVMFPTKKEDDAPPMPAIAAPLYGGGSAPGELASSHGIDPESSPSGPASPVSDAEDRALLGGGGATGFHHTLPAVMREGSSAFAATRTGVSGGHSSVTQAGGRSIGSLKLSGSPGRGGLVGDGRALTAAAALAL